MVEDKTPVFSEIENKIFNIRGVPIMLDRDLAALYQTDTRTLKQSVKRNIDKFPADFMFELQEHDIESLVSHAVIPSRSFFGGAAPFAFTEQGVAMLASVIKTTTSVKISITIIRDFVAMRKTIAVTGNLVKRIEVVEKKLLHTDEKFEKIFTALEKKDNLPTQGIFFNGQIFDTYTFLADIVRKARHSIILIDNYVDDSTLKLFIKRKKNVSLTIYTKKITPQLETDTQKFNQQYGPLFLKKIINNHDRFLIIDHKEMYHIGASIKDLGKKIFAFSRMDNEVDLILKVLKQ